MRFTKMHGLGNDYVYVNGFAERLPDDAGELSRLARAVADRHFGVGGDGMILVLPSSSADVRMRMFNADGSEGEMCGNGVRCVAKFAFDHGLTKANPMRVETGRGILSIALDVDAGKVRAATVDMDKPLLGIDAVGAKQGAAGRNAYFKNRIDHHTFALAYEIGGRHLDGTLVSMGNPHVVVFVDDVEAIDLSTHGPKLENYGGFPKRINVHFAQVIDARRLKMRTWERGSGVTLACGTGACAVLVAAHLRGLAGRDATVTLPGGDLQIRWDAQSDHVFMTGPATEVFSGEWDC